MPIEITGNSPNKINTSQGNTTARDTGKSHTELRQSTTLNVSDSTTLTNTASTLNTLHSTIVSQPIVDLQKVEDIQQMLHDDTIEKNNLSVANKMVALEYAIYG